MTGTAHETLEGLADRYPLPDWRRPALAVVALLTAAGIWAMLARLDEVVVAEGEVVPQGRIKTIQHLEGGIIEEILVEEGVRVERDQPLVVLDLASSGFNLDALRAQLDGLDIRHSRLTAEVNGDPPEYPAAPASRRPKIVAAEQRTFDKRRAQLESALAVAREQVLQHRFRIAELEAGLAGLKAGLRPAEERFALSESLLKEELTPRLEHLRLEQELEQLRSGIVQTGAALSRSRAELAEASEREREILLTFESDVSEELAANEVDIARVREMLKAAQDQDRRTVITAPIEGFAQNIRYHTVGGVVRPGEPIMQLVPAYDKLLIEARVSPNDIGHIEVGLPVTVKITTYDYIRYGGLEGTIVKVSADANTDDAGRQWFRAFVETERGTLGKDGELPITAGMLATVDIHIGTKRVMEYLVGPVLRMRHEAFRER